MEVKNKYGLLRTIPEGVKREVRQRCGFGCVRCGGAIVQYDHFAPPFADCKIHDPAGIVLLCGGCHAMKTVGRLSDETLAEFAVNPRCRQTGFSFGPFDIGTVPPEISIGSVTATNCPVLLRISGDNVFGVSPPAAAGQPYLINAAFRDDAGNPLLEIVENEWRSNSENWDVEVVGQVITIRKALRNLVLQIRTNPPHQLIVERLEMFHKDWRVSCRDGWASVTADGKTYWLGEIHFKNSRHAAIMVGENDVLANNSRGLR